MRRTRRFSRILSSCVLCVLVQCLPLLTLQRLVAQNTPSSTDFYLEAFAFKSDSSIAGKRVSRIDVFVTVPFESIQFSKVQSDQGTQYVGQYTLVITATDSASGRPPVVITKGRSMNAQSLSATLGATGEFDNTQTIALLPTGDYTITAEIIDELAQRSLKRSRVLTVLDMNDYDYSLSSIMLASSIVQKGNRYALTPYLNDNITKIVNEPVLAFFEAYNNTNNNDSLDILCEIINPKTRKVVGRNVTRKFSPHGTTQHYVVLPLGPQSPAGTFGVRLTALRQGADSLYDDKDIRAISERIIKIEWASDFAELPTGIALERAIRQMRYVAIPSQIDSILTAPTDDERHRRF